MNKKHVRLTEAHLHKIVKESVKKILKEQNISQEYKNAINEVVEKMISTLNFNEQSFLYDMINHLPNEIIYTFMGKLQHYDYQ